LLTKEVTEVVKKPLNKFLNYFITEYYKNNNIICNLTSTHEIPSWNISNLNDRGFYSVKLSNNLSSNLGCHLDSVLKKKRINVKEYNILQDFLESDLDEIRQHQESYLPFIVDTTRAIKYVEERRKLEEK
jgi:hypothetical protein